MKKQPITVDYVDEIKNEVEVGDYIGFEYLEEFGIEPRLITGIVKEHHAHTFLLDNGHSYRWADYARGRVI